MDALENNHKENHDTINRFIASKIMGWHEHEWRKIDGKFGSYYNCSACNLKYYGEERPNGFCNHTAFGPPPFTTDIKWAWELYRHYIDVNNKSKN